MLWLKVTSPSFCATEAGDRKGGGTKTGEKGTQSATRLQALPASAGIAKDSQLLRSPGSRHSLWVVLSAAGLCAGWEEGRKGKRRREEVKRRQPHEHKRWTFDHTVKAAILTFGTIPWGHRGRDLSTESSWFKRTGVEWK